MNGGLALDNYDKSAFKSLCDEFIKNNQISPSLYEKYHVKRGLRNSDGSGVMAGITNICNVHGYIVNEGEREPVRGELIYRGYSINDIVENTTKKGRFGFEETAYLLLFGQLPTEKQLSRFNELLSGFRELPAGFSEDMIFKAPSKNIMNKMARSVLALYSYDEDDPEDQSLECELLRAMKIIARLPSAMVDAYQIKRRVFDHESLYMHPLNPDECTAQTILSTLRMDRVYTEEEARLLDLMLLIHVEHGGGNNSTFTCRTLTSAGTDAYSAYAGAIGSLKGHRHGGANIKVIRQLEEFKENISDWRDDGQVSDYLAKVIRGEAGDGTGLIYGMGHAVYTLSDPRAVILKENAMKLAAGTEFEAEFRLLDAVERLTPKVFAEVKGSSKVMCANVDLYAGLVYRMLKIPAELNTPLFAVARIVGWSAHRIEELLTGKRIIRPAYKAVAQRREYVPIEER
ncbi:MAG: citrate synthase [Ruminococcus sp.]|nr:citrate synthase [Ruminococcus sp.]MCM1381497.1 citrate synthase [Muribaculaceae bacterium]MCM1479668.1 citrate synthase [Muribaculaceae bacterium]